MGAAKGDSALMLTETIVKCCGADKAGSVNEAGHEVGQIKQNARRIQRPREQKSVPFAI